MTSRLARIASWVGPPLGMSLAYTVLAITSETDTSGKAWMAMGFGFVLVLWIVFRLLVEHAGLARAIAVGDADKILSITDTQLPRKRGAARARLLVHRAVAHELRTDWAAALAALDEAGGIVPDELALLAASVRASALAETGDAAAARRVIDSELESCAARLDRRLYPLPHHHASLARARVQLAEGAREAARAELQRVIDDIRAGSAIRARAIELASGAGRER